MENLGESDHRMCGAAEAHHAHLPSRENICYSHIRILNAYLFKRIKEIKIKIKSMRILEE